MLASWLGAALLLPHVVAFPVPHESSTCVGYLSTFLLSWSGAVSGASVSIVRKLVYLAATLLAALGGFARGLGPSRGLAVLVLPFCGFSSSPVAARCILSLSCVGCRLVQQVGLSIKKRKSKFGKLKMLNVFFGGGGGGSCT